MNRNILIIPAVLIASVFSHADVRQRRCGAYRVKNG